jgi:hypothetical protein
MKESELKEGEELRQCDQALKKCEEELGIQEKQLEKHAKKCIVFSLQAVVMFHICHCHIMFVETLCYNF